MGTRRRRDLVFVAWGNWGPYHYARFDAFAELATPVGYRVVGLELYRRSGIYDWQPHEPSGPMVRLGFRPPEDRVRPLRMIFSAAPLIFRSRPAVIFVPSYRPTSLMLNVFARLCGARVIMMNDTHAQTTSEGAVRGLFKRLVVRRFHAALVGGTKHKDFAVSLGLAPDRSFSVTTSWTTAISRNGQPLRDNVPTQFGPSTTFPDGMFSALVA